MCDLGPGLVHASCVDWNGRGLLILGPSGSGKSSLAADLISRGAVLVSDDQTMLVDEDGPVARPAPRLEGLIELRGFGIAKRAYSDRTKLRLVVDLAKEATIRLPGPQFATLCGYKTPLIAGQSVPNMAASLSVFLTSDGLLET